MIIQDRDEAGLVGLLINKPECVPEASMIVRPSHFKDKCLALVYAAILDLYDDQKPICPLGLFDFLNRVLSDPRAIKHYPYTEYPISKIEASYLAELSEFGNLVMPVHSARAIRDRGIRQNLKLFGAEVAYHVDQSASGEEAYEIVSNRLLDITFAINDGDVIDSPSAMKEYMDFFDKRQSGQIPGGIPYGIRSLDAYTGGMHEQELIIVAARASVGKTAIAMQMTHHAAKKGYPVMIFSLEQSRSDVLDRLVASEANLDLVQMRKGKLSNEEQLQVIDVGEQICNRKIYWDDTPNQSLNSIIAKARRAKLNCDIKLITIDYLQLIDVERGRARHEEIAVISKKLKQLARELRIPIVVLAQLNREADNDEEPRLRHLKEGGSIEQDADTVIILHRNESKQNQVDSSLGLIDIYLKKQRSGPTGNFDVIFRKKCVRFENHEIEMPTGW